MKSNAQSGLLYIVATPIGNFADLSIRQQEVLQDVDVVLCERPQHSRRLFTHANIQPKRIAKLTDHDKAAALVPWLTLLGQGQSIACISDAGTPMISDPGVLLVQMAHKAGVRVVPIPGPSAVSAAVSISGFAVNGYSFYGFLPAKKQARVQMYTRVGDSLQASVFFESPHRLAASLADLEAALGPDQVLLLHKEISKIYERYWIGTVADVRAALDSSLIKGEFVLVLAPNGQSKPQAPAALDPSAVLTLFKDDGIRLQQAVSLAHKLTGYGKNSLYKMALSIYANT